MDAFLEGFYDIIPKKLISIFNEQELELLISGLPEIDIDDLCNNTEYKSFNRSSPQVQWFWRSLRSFEQEDLAKFLQFVTGTSKVNFYRFFKIFLGTVARILSFRRYEWCSKVYHSYGHPLYGSIAVCAHMVSLINMYL